MKTIRDGELWLRSKQSFWLFRHSKCESQSISGFSPFLYYVQNIKKEATTSLVLVFFCHFELVYRRPEYNLPVEEEVNEIFDSAAYSPQHFGQASGKNI
jgi:hypothetical protein